MIRTKLFTRHLAKVPWLLAAGLALGWTPVEAVGIRLFVDRERVREEAGRTEITVVAKHYDDSGELADVPEDTFVNVTPSTVGLNSRFTIEQTTLVIRQDESSASGTIIFTPIEDDLKGNDDVDDGIDDDLNIEISGSAGATPVIPTSITLIDNDKESQNIRLAFSPAMLSKRAGPIEIAVTAELDGKVMTSDVSFQLLIDGASSSAGRGTDYSATLASIKILKRKASGTATITIVPKDRGTGIIAVTGDPDGINVIAGQIAITEASLGITSLTATPASVRENAGPTKIALTVTLDEVPVVDEPVRFRITSPGSGKEAVREIDYRATLPPGSAITIPAGRTSGTATLTFTPLNNEEEDGDRFLSMQATSSDGSEWTTITILDDETLSQSIELSVNPAEIREDAGATEVAITATLTGKALDEDVTLLFQTDAGTAILDVDYVRPSVSLTIPADQTQGSTTVTITPTDDGTEEPNETITFRVASNPQNEDGDPIVVGTATITLKDTGEGGSSAFSFSADAAINDYRYTVGTAIAALVLPEASGGTAPLTYSVSTLPAGLSFDAATRTLSGTPTAATNGAVTVVYTVIDDDGATDALTFSITVRIRPEFGDFGSSLDLFSGGTEAEESEESEETEESEESEESEETEEPSLAFAADAAIDDQVYTTGTAIADLVLPAASGGTGELTYSVSALPAGLAFDAATRTLSGTPTAATDGAVDVVYTVTDEDGTTDALTFTITVNERPTFDDFFNLFGSSKVVPTASHGVTEIREFIVGQRVEGLVLPEASGGTAPLTYSLSPALPAGLAFDAVTRTIEGTPRAAAETVYTYAVTDANGASASLSLQTLPTSFSLVDNFPNPFNPTTTIQYALPQAADVELTVYNVVGQVVRTLVAERQSAGRYAVEWDATDDSGHSLSSGMYFYRLQAGGEFREVKKMLLLR